MDTKQILERLRIIKDIDPFNKKLLNDCYAVIKELIERNESLEKQLNELTGIKYDL